MRISQLLLRKVGPFEDATLDFPPGTDSSLADVYLLTGPNGCGKSTALYALASAIAGGSSLLLGKDPLVARIREDDSVVAATADDGHQCTVARSLVGGQRRNSIEAPLSGATVPLVREGGPGVGYYASDATNPFSRYQQSCDTHHSNVPRNARSQLVWAAFAYAGSREVGDGHVEAIKEPTESPLAGSLAFMRPMDSTRLANWIVNQQFKRFKAVEAGRSDRAAMLEQSIKTIEGAIAQIVEDEFAFVTSDEDTQVSVRFGSRVFPMGLMPDGLKSVVSWIADLLMRLDSVSWETDAPTTERPFLLLLDELDVHLHPAWQRKVLPVAQRLFPHAQIIATTHSPFVVASVADAHIISLKVSGGVAEVDSTSASQLGVSYSAVLRSIFGISSEFDLETEREFAKLHATKERLLRGESTDRSEFDRIAAALGQRSEEVGQLVGIELRQLERQLRQRSAG